VKKTQGSGDVAPHPNHFTPQGKSPGVPQSWSGHSGEEKKSLPLLGIEPSSSSPQCSHYTD